MPKASKNKGGSINLAAAATPFILLAGKTFMESQTKKSDDNKRNVRNMYGGQAIPPVSGTPTSDASVFMTDTAYSIQDNNVSKSTGDVSAPLGLPPSTPATSLSKVGGGIKSGGRSQQKDEDFDLLEGGKKVRKVVSKKKHRGGQSPDMEADMVPLASMSDDTYQFGGKSQRGGQDMEEVLVGGKSQRSGKKANKIKKINKKKGGNLENEGDQEQEIIDDDDLDSELDAIFDEKEKEETVGGRRRTRKVSASKKKPTARRARKLNGGALEMYSQQLQELTQSLKALLS